MSKKTKARCRFPAVRIKKIMQADDDVGKISKDTPVLVSRSIELFVHELVKQAAELAKQNNSTMIHPCYLKQCISRNEMWDFLEEVVKEVPDSEPEVKKRQRVKKAKGEEGAGDDEEEDEEEDEEDEEDEDGSKSKEKKRKATRKKSIKKGMTKKKPKKRKAST